MTLDKSLRSKVGMRRQRNVLNRAERVAKLKLEGLWKETDSVFGLRKVRVEVIKRRAKAKKEVVAAAPGVVGAAPAADAKAAAGKAAPGKAPAGKAPAAKGAPAKAEGKGEKKGGGEAKK